MFFTSTIDPAFFSNFFSDLSLERILSAAVLLLICVIFIRLLLKMTTKLLDKSKLEMSLHTFVFSAVKLVLIFIAIMLLAQTLGIDTTSLLAVFSIAGLALSLSIQDALSNLASAMMILASKPFQVGDFIEVKGRSGTVTEIGLIYTKLATIDRQVICIPNSHITSNDLANASASDSRQLVLPIKLAPGSDVEQVKTALLAVAQDERILSDQPVFARMTNLEVGSLEFTLRVWTKREDYWDLRVDMLEGIKAAFDAQGIALAQPTMLLRQEHSN